MTRLMFIAMLFAVACGDDDGADDAGSDASRDAVVDSGGDDAGDDAGGDDAGDDAGGDDAGGDDAAIDANIDAGECVEAGGSRAVVPSAPPCCEGLDSVGCDEPDPSSGECVLCEGASFCSDCGNGTCEEWENICRCPEDCS